MTEATDQKTVLTEDWLRTVGFKWHQFDRQPDKHWLLLIGGVTAGRPTFQSFEDIGLELAPCAYRNRNGDLVNQESGWFCWLRDDAAGRYHRFIHIRHVHFTSDVIRLFEALTGQAWDPTNHLYGNAYRSEDAARLRQEAERLDRRLTLGAGRHAKWATIEEDDTRGRALPEHMTAAEHHLAEKRKARGEDDNV